MLDKIFSIKEDQNEFRSYKFVTILGIKFKKRILSKFDILKNKLIKEGLTPNEKKLFLELPFKYYLGYDCNFDNPKSFNEKIQWLKLYYRNPLMTQCADKYKVREYVKEKIGEEYLIRLLGSYDSPDEIDFNTLPNQFVIKVNWGSGQNIIVKNKSKLNIMDTKKKLQEWMKPEYNWYYSGLEWCYKNIKPKIIIEEYLTQLDGDLFDYKYLCYNGKVKNLFVVSDRFNNKWLDFYDTEWKHLPFKRLYNNSPNKIEKPNNFIEMTKLAETLAKEFPFCRVDFYNINGKIYFGEITFYPGNGLEPFEPIEWDYKLGDMINLPEPSNDKD